MATNKVKKLRMWEHHIFNKGASEVVKFNNQFDAGDITIGDLSTKELDVSSKVSQALIYARMKLLATRKKRRV